MLRMPLITGSVAKRDEKIRPLQRVRSYKRLRHDPNHRELRIVDLQLLPDHIGCAVEPALPERFADNHAKTRRIATFAVIRRV